METIFLKKLEQTPSIKGHKSRGISAAEIQNLEQKLKIKFPIAYKEYLFLGGKYCYIPNGGWNFGFVDLEFMQEEAQNVVNDEGLLLRPFWCFAEYNNAESFLFFFFDEGDNPPIYNFIADKGLTDEQGKAVSYKKAINSFSEYIDRCIESSLK